MKCQSPACPNKTNDFGWNLIEVKMPTPPWQKEKGQMYPYYFCSAECLISWAKNVAVEVWIFNADKDDAKELHQYG